MALFVKLGWFFREHRRTYLLALLMLAGVAVLNMAVPWLVGRAIDALVAGNGKAGLQLLALLALGVALYGLRFGWRLVLFGTSYRLGNLLRLRLFQRLTRQGQAFYTVHNTGDLMARATNDIDAVELAAGEGVLSGFDGALTLVLVLLMMLVVIDWRLTLVALLPFPLMAFGFYRISSAVHHQFQRALEQFSRLNDRTQEALSGIRLVKAMGRERAEDLAFAAIAQDAADTNYRVARSEALYEPVIFLCMAAALALSVGYGAWLILQQSLTVGALASFILYLGQLIWPMFAFGWLLNIVERGSAGFDRIEQLLKTPDSIDDSGVRMPDGADIVVQGLGFTYPGSRSPALQSIDFSLPAGGVLGIAGPTGAGKSTLLQLLMRYWERSDGEIRFGGQPLPALSLSALRRGFAYVPQDAFLFSLSIGDNIALGRPGASAQAIENAARLASVHEDIVALAQGYDTLVGERGLTLSGGQRQRLAIARALLSDAPVLVLDDALSAVDVQTEQRILAALRHERHGRSCIIVSHRLSALQHADEILVLSHGHLQERGDHAALMARDGWYGRMYRYQKLEASLDAF
ncbi:multidrug ABC transporter permease/ATP-binding protein [Marinobacterium nitratireducens]|uniref:Multidrug resistance-like ATP-binding protein MdlA n=1 Tax=Marinobacterium nitratireducens TaxID=518897 RepID=A0A918DSJ3_9GAMM|nr:ABC transporter transmembrane domain-containing protein [Marinobacterium nitratireducens]GGO82242.1 multidrug ABC transporter permease/ATP-binding protein [Marinobacterium nitratireducens]